VPGLVFIDKTTVAVTMVGPRRTLLASEACRAVRPLEDSAALKLPAALRSMASRSAMPLRDGRVFLPLSLMKRQGHPARSQDRRRTGSARSRRATLHHVPLTRPTLIALTRRSRRWRCGRVRYAPTRVSNHPRIFTTVHLRRVSATLGLPAMRQKSSGKYASPATVLYGKCPLSQLRKSGEW